MVTPLEALKAKYMKDPDIIPEKGQDKEVIVEAMAEQQVRQKKNNERAFELLTKAGSKEVDSGASGGAKEGGDSAMYRLTEFVQKPVEKTELDRKMWGEPTKKHLKIMNRPLEVLNKDDIDKISLNAPPAEGSDEEKVELEQLEELSGLLSDDQIKDRIDAQDEDLLEMFDRYLRDQDINLDKEEVKKVMRDVNTILFRFKYYYNRPRPHQASDKIKEIDNTAGKSPSYPSGHSTAGAVIAELLARKYPEHAEALRVIGTEIGYNRVIAGLHYLSDHIAGLDLAGQILSLLLDDEVKKSDAFMDELFKYMAHREELFKDMTQIGTQDILDGVRINKEKNPRIPRKEGQPAKSKKHSDLYTDEDPKGTITGLGFKDDTTARASVKKIRNSGRSHAHKIQAAVAMEQRAKAAGKSSEAAIYRKYIDSMKAKTKRLEKHTEDEHAQEHSASDEYYPKASVDKAKKSLLDQLGQIQSKIVTGDYQIEKFLTKADEDWDPTSVLTGLGNQAGAEAGVQENEDAKDKAERERQEKDFDDTVDGIERYKEAIGKLTDYLNTNTETAVERPTFEISDKNPAEDAAKIEEFKDRAIKLFDPEQEGEIPDLDQINAVLSENELDTMSEEDYSRVQQLSTELDDLFERILTGESDKILTETAEGIREQFEGFSTVKSPKEEIEGIKPTLHPDHRKKYEKIRDDIRARSKSAATDRSLNTLLDTITNYFTDIDPATRQPKIDKHTADSIMDNFMAAVTPDTKAKDLAGNFVMAEGEAFGRGKEDVVPEKEEVEAKVEAQQLPTEPFVSAGNNKKSAIKINDFYIREDDGTLKKPRAPRGTKFITQTNFSETLPANFKKLIEHDGEGPVVGVAEQYAQNLIDTLNQIHQDNKDENGNLTIDTNDFNRQIFSAINDAVNTENSDYKALKGELILTDVEKVRRARTNQKKRGLSSVSELQQFRKDSAISALEQQLIDTEDASFDHADDFADDSTGELVFNDPDAEATYNEYLDEIDNLNEKINNLSSPLRTEYSPIGLTSFTKNAVRNHVEQQTQKVLQEAALLAFTKDNALSEDSFESDARKEGFESLANYYRSLLPDSGASVAFEGKRAQGEFIKSLARNSLTQEGVQNHIENTYNKMLQDITGEGDPTKIKLEDLANPNLTYDAKKGIDAYFQGKNDAVAMGRLLRMAGYSNEEVYGETTFEDGDPIKGGIVGRIIRATDPEYIKDGDTNFYDTKELEKNKYRNVQRLLSRSLENTPSSRLNDYAFLAQTINDSGIDETDGKNYGGAWHDMQIRPGIKESERSARDEGDKPNYSEYIERATNAYAKYDENGELLKGQQPTTGEARIIEETKGFAELLGISFKDASKSATSKYVDQLAVKGAREAGRVQNALDKHISHEYKTETDNHNFSEPQPINTPFYKDVLNGGTGDLKLNKESDIYKTAPEYYDSMMQNYDDWKAKQAEGASTSYGDFTNSDAGKSWETMNNYVNSYNTLARQSYLKSEEILGLGPMQFGNEWHLGITNVNTEELNPTAGQIVTNLTDLESIKQKDNENYMETLTVEQAVKEGLFFGGFKYKDYDPKKDTDKNTGLINNKKIQDILEKNNYDIEYGIPNAVSDAAINAQIDKAKIANMGARDETTEETKVDKEKITKQKNDGEPNHQKITKKYNKKQKDDSARVVDEAGNVESKPGDQTSEESEKDASVETEESTVASEPTGDIKIVGRLQEGADGLEHLVVQLNDGETLQVFAQNPGANNKYQPHEGIVNTKDGTFHANGHNWFLDGTKDPNRGYGHPLLKQIGERLDGGEFNEQIESLEAKKYRNAKSPAKEAERINNALEEFGIEISPHLKDSIKNPVEDRFAPFKGDPKNPQNDPYRLLKTGMENMGTAPSEIAQIKAFKGFYFDAEHGVLNGNGNLEEIFKKHGFGKTEVEESNEVTVNPDGQLGLFDEGTDFSAERSDLTDDQEQGETVDEVKPEAEVSGDQQQTVSDEQQQIDLPPSGFTDSGTETGFSSVDFLAGVPEELHGEINSVFNDPEMVDRLKSVYEDEIHPDDQNQIPFDEWAKVNVVGDKGTTAAKIRAKFVPKARKITEAKAKEAPPPSGDSGAGGVGEGPSEGKQFSEDDATRLAGELSDEIMSMPELFKFDGKTQNKTEMANNRTMSQRARRLHRMMGLDSHPEIHEKLSAAAKNKLRTEQNGIRKHLPNKIKQAIEEETKQYDKDSFYDHKDDSKQHNQDIEARRQASAVNEQAHDKKVKEIHEQGSNHEIFQSDTHNKNMQLQEWTGGEGGTRDMEAEFDEFMDKKYGADYSKEDAAKERREQGLPPGAPRPRLVKDKDGVEKFLGYYLWHAASRHWVTPEYAKLHPDLAGGAGAGNVITGLENMKDGSGALAYQPHDDAARDAGIAGLVTKDGVMQLANKKGDRDEFNNRTFGSFSNVNDHLSDEDAEYSNTLASVVEDKLNEIRGGAGGVATGAKGQRIGSYRGGGALANYSARMSAAGGFKGALARFVSTITPTSLGGGPVKEQYLGRGSREE